MDQVKAYERKLNQHLNHVGFLNDIERQTNLPKSYIVGGFAALYLLLVYLNIGGVGQFFANLAAVVIPGYYSLIALETAGKSDDTQFLIYWVVYAAFTIIEAWSSVITYWIPAYWLFKTFFFLWLGLPAFSGARYVYSSVIRPFSTRFLGIKPNMASSLDENVKKTFKQN